MRLRNLQISAGLAVAVAALANAPTAQASLLLYDGFGYSAGNLGGDSAASGYTWAAPSPQDTVVTGSLSYPASVGSAPATVGNSVEVPGNGSSGSTSNRININSDGSSITANGSSVYYSFLLNISASDTTGIEPNTFTGPDSSGLQGLVAGLVDAGAGNGGLGTLDNGIYLRAGSTAGTFNVGVAGTRGHSGPVGWSGDFTIGQTVFIVGQYNIVTNGSSYTEDVYVNPTLGQSAPTPDGTSTASGEDGGHNDGGVSSFFLASDAGTTPDFQIDELRLGTTFADVTPAGTPEPASLGLLGVSGLMLLRRRRRS